MRKLLYYVVNAIHWIAIVITAVLGFVIKVDTAWISGNFAPLLPLLFWLKARTWWLFISSLAAALSAVIVKKVGAPWVRDAVQHVLDEMRTHALRDQPEGPSYHYRVTLFRRTSFCWRALKDRRTPIGGYLVPFARSGHVTQKVTVYFSVPDSADGAEGVAGEAFVGGYTVVREDLPDVSRDGALKRDLDRYASETFVTVNWLRKERSTARSLIGFPIRVKGRHWGAIVVDSHSERIQDKDRIIKSYELVSVVLGELLERS